LKNDRVEIALSFGVLAVNPLEKHADFRNKAETKRIKKLKPLSLQ